MGFNFLCYNLSMDLREIYSYNSFYKKTEMPKISFEVKVSENSDISNLFDELRMLKKFNPVMVSLSVGENSKMQGLSIELLQMVQDLELNVLPDISGSHLSKELVEHYITRIENLGIENILLTGRVSSIDFENTVALVDFIHQKSTLSIGIKENIENVSEIVQLKNKIEAGVSVIFTEKFDDNRKFFSYIDLIRKIGVNVPIVAGVDPHLKQCENLLQAGVSGLHFSINKNLDIIDEIMKGVSYGKLK